MSRERPTSGPAPARSVRFLALLALLAVLVLFLRFPSRSPSPTQRPSSGIANPPSTATPAALEEAVVREFSALESVEGEAARTILAPELRAEDLGASVEDLWNRLNASSNAWSVLRDAPVRSLAGPGPMRADPSPLPYGLRRLRSSGPPAPPQPWSAVRPQLDRAQNEGWRFDRSEWRHVAFAPATNHTPDRSHFEIRLHLTRLDPPTRAQIHARVRLDWPADADPASRTGSELGDATVEDCEVIVRDGPPAFERVDLHELQPFPRTTWIDPLIHHDLDGDGQPEILLVARNLLLRRQPDGHWTESELTPHHPGLLFTALLADFTGDGRPDLLCAVRTGLVLLAGGATGTFDTPPVPAWIAPQRLDYAQAFTCGDIDGDGDLDVFLGQYRTPYTGGQMPYPYFDALDGPPAFLLRNDGSGHFTDVTPDSGLEPKRHRRSYGASLVDLDADGDLDLWVSSDFAGADVWINDGQGHFANRTAPLLDEPRGFGMSQTFSDFDADGRIDALLLGMPQPTADRLDALHLERPGFETWADQRARVTFGNRLFFGSDDGFRQRPAGRDIARAGWAWSAAAFDLDYDRFPDLYIANGHESRQSVRDYEREFWTHDIYVGNSTPRPAVDAYFAAKFAASRARGWSYGGYDLNRLYLNRGGNGFVEIAHTLGVGLQTDCRNALAEDLDGDGDLDLIVTTFEIWPRARQTLQIFENRLPSVGHWTAFRLKSAPGTVPNPGVSITIHDRLGSQTRVGVLGDGYRSQGPPILRFGLGDVTEVDRAELHWPGGRTVHLEHLAVDRIHEVIAPRR